MTTESLLSTLQFLSKTDGKLQLQQTLTTVNNALASLVQNPANPPQQQALATALVALLAAYHTLENELTPETWSRIEQIGGSDVFSPSLADEIQSAVRDNAMTPSVAATQVSQLLKTREDFLKTINETLKGLERLGVTSDTQVAGQASVGIIVPRQLFGSELNAFSKELAYISRFIAEIGEAATGQPESAELGSLSSSSPTVFIIATAGTLKILAETVKAFLDVWNKVQEMRKTREEVLRLNLSPTAVSEMDDRVTAVVEEVVESTTSMTLEHFPGEDDRRNELENALRADTRRLFGQIEQGLVLQFRAAESVEDAAEHTEDLARISELGKTLEFPQPSKTPLLLDKGSLIEGDAGSFQITTTTVTKRTTSTRKTAAKQ